MPLSFETAGGVHSLVLQEQAVRLHAGVFADAVGGPQEGLALSDGDAHLRRGEGQQLAEPPDAAEVQRIIASRPKTFDLGEGLRRLELVPFVPDIQQVAAPGTSREDLAHIESGGALGRDALLVGGVGIHGKLV